mmetsp:Transcript_12266/g.36016  ORF Transcript_12266/g.36016 Transcript_12266/m.36016 type:complete len:231 (-) Transcript_12266:19-711(-)
MPSSPALAAAAAPQAPPLNPRRRHSPPAAAAPRTLSLAVRVRSRAQDPLGAPWPRPAAQSSRQQTRVAVRTPPTAPVPQAAQPPRAPQQPQRCPRRRRPRRRKPCACRPWPRVGASSTPQRALRQRRCQRTSTCPRQSRRLRHSPLRRRPGFRAHHRAAASPVTLGCADTPASARGKDPPAARAHPHRRMRAPSPRVAAAGPASRRPLRPRIARPWHPGRTQRSAAPAGS